MTFRGFGLIGDEGREELEPLSDMTEHDVKSWKVLGSNVLVLDEVL